MASAPKFLVVRVIFMSLPFVYGIAVFTAVTANQFWLDDYGWVSTAARASHDPSYLLKTQADFFRPAVNFVFFVNFLVSELDPAGYYRFNIALHLLNVVLLMVLTFQITRNNFWTTVLAGLLYAGAIGNYGEAVIWISGRTELIAVTWYLSTLVLFWKYLIDKTTGIYIAVVACFALALLSKESAVTLLPTMFLLQWLAGDTRSADMLRPNNLARYLPFALILGTYLVAQIYLVPENAVVEEQRYSIGWHVFPNLIEYLALMFVPIGPDSTVVDVSGSAANFIANAQLLFGLLIAGFWILVIVWMKSPMLRFAVAWMTLTILPYAFFTTKTTVRYLYLPSAGFTLAAAFLIVAILSRYQRRLSLHPIRTAGILAILVAVLAIQWIVVNTIIRQWSEWQSQQDPVYLETLQELGRSLGVGN